ncbi:integrating conjugative element protein [Shewanella baltica]|uniref:integrating conjugative element protein n=1 Tax=Shewanella baltica TaxID=62322 RepID=UPI00217E09F3|nr:integrating conjugative element protein [Shewanella baltica]MCS6271886.1 integrating conjugative element protein [Shewanella baltica]
MGIRSRCIPLTIKRRASAFIFGVCFSLIGFNSYSFELLEVGRVGPTSSASVFYKNISLKDVKVDKNLTASLLERSKKELSPDLFFPITPKTMKPGLIKGHRFDSSKSIMPFAIVGTDALSLKWLEFRYEKLMEYKAAVFVIEADSLLSIKNLEKQYIGLRFIPVSGDKIGEDLKVQAYPFLVISSGVWQ